MSVTIADYRVELPAGGPLHLQTPDEVELWNTSLQRYRDDYVLVKQNDLTNLGALLQAQILLFRAQTAINGMEPELDAGGVPTGSYRRVELDAADILAYQKTMNTASQEMRALEKALGIDKSTREQGGAHTIENYLRTLKRAAHERGVHITKMTTEYQGLVKELSWKLRILYNADAEDRAYHNITPRSILDWLQKEVKRFEDLDKEYAREKGRLYIGHL